MPDTPPIVPQHLIKPLVGQILHYWPLQCEKTHNHDQPFRADICHINTDGTVNLIVSNEIGIETRRTRVPLVQGQPPKSGEASYPKHR